MIRYKITQELKDIIISDDYVRLIIQGYTIIFKGFKDSNYNFKDRLNLLNGYIEDGYIYINNDSFQ